MKHSENELKIIANKLRMDTLEMAPRSGNAIHIGPAYSSAEILTVLYYEIMNIRLKSRIGPNATGSSFLKATLVRLCTLCLRRWASLTVKSCGT